jgi:lysozyme family protein
MIDNRNRYEAVAEATLVPWYVIAVIHQMESNCNFGTHLHNGDPLTARTTRVPKGRPVTGNPPFTWEFSAIDALGFDKIDCSSLGAILDSLEKYNGLGYRNGAGKGTTPPETSPYLWSFTDQYLKGKYIEDGKFSSEAVSLQAGCVALFKVLEELANIKVGKPTTPIEKKVGWFEAHLLLGADRSIEIGIAAKQSNSDITLATARFSVEPALQKRFLDTFPNAVNIVAAPAGKPWPGEAVIARWEQKGFSGPRTFQRGEDVKLSKDFHLSEFECRCGCRTTVVNGDHVKNMQRLRDLLGKPVHITSGYRCPTHNRAVGGATNSQHLYGNACDIVVDGLKAREVYDIADKMQVFNGIGKYVSFTHVDSRKEKARW